MTDWEKPPRPPSWHMPFSSYAVMREGLGGIPEFLSTELAGFWVFSLREFNKIKFQNWDLANMSAEHFRAKGDDTVTFVPWLEVKQILSLREFFDE
jgi:hypothetical protein